MLDRLNKLFSREFLAGLLPFILGSIALFMIKDAQGNPTVDFDQWGFWSAIFLGVSSGALTIQKGLLKKGGKDDG